jgi:hypothetical protein
MSRVRPGTCAEPGPLDTHCQDYPGHPYTCHDGQESWAEWHFEAHDLPPHECSDPACHAPQPADKGSSRAFDTP